MWMKLIESDAIMHMLNKVIRQLAINHHGVVIPQQTFTGAQIVDQTVFGQGSGSILERVDCQGTEVSLANCVLSDYDDKYNECYHRDDVAVRCGK